MAANQIQFNLTDDNLKIDTSSSCGVGQYFYVKLDGSNGTDTMYQTNECMKLSISRIYYKKTIYKPGFVDVEMTIDNFEHFTSNKYADALRIYFLSPKVADKKTTMRTLSLESGTTKYIDGYYITDLAFKQKIVNHSRITIVVLKAYSPDYFLTLQKYSKVYRGKKLSEIIENTLKKTFSGDDSILKSRFKHAYLCHTTDRSNNELKQPYLVQYNETFHDFVVRTANRCGELFYYEDGKLILGVDGSNLSSDKKDIAALTEITGTLPENMAFSTIPAPFVKEVKNIGKSYLGGIAKTSEGTLYYNENIEFDDAIHDTSMDDAKTASEMAESQWYAVATKALNAGSFTDAITNASNKAIDIKMSSGMIAAGKAMPLKSKPCLQKCEVDINNSFHSQVPGLTGTDQTIKDAFKASYEKDYPEEFMESETVPVDPFEKQGGKANNELKAYITKASNLTRNHVKAWKAVYKKDHPDQFKNNEQLADNVIFGPETKGEDYINKYIKANSRKMTDKEVEQWKKEYEAGKGKEYFEGKTGDEKTMIWDDTTSQPYKDLQKAIIIPPTADKIEQAKKKYKEDNPKACVRTFDMTDDEVEAAFNNPATAPGKAFNDYKELFGNDYDKIISTEEDIETVGCKEYFAEKKEESGKSTFDAAWYEQEWKKCIDSHPKESDKDASKHPYWTLVNRFKKTYKDEHPKECKETIDKKVANTSKIWDKEESRAFKALAEYLSYYKDASNFSNKYYAWIEKQEKMCSDSIQVHRIVSETIPSYRLGQYCKLSSSCDGYVYIVNQIEVEVTSQTGGSDYMLDTNITISKTHENKSRAEANAYQYNTFPPMSDIPHIRKSEPQLAIVTDVADPQRAGRVQIRYPWSDEEKAKSADGTVINTTKDKPGKSASPWIPVAVPFVGGKDSGFLMTPDKDDYVMVNYEGGNIERPYVDGSIFHGKKSTNWGSVPLVAKAQDFRGTKHAITYKGNGITFVPGNATTFLTGMLPSVIGGPIAKFVNTKMNDDMRFGGGMTLTDHYGTYNISMSSAGRSIDIESPWGNVNINAFTGIKISAPNGDIKIEGKNVTIEAGNKVEIVSGKNIKKTGVNVHSMVKEIVGAVTKVAGSAVGSALKNSLKTASGIDLGKSVDLSFVRNVWEIIFRPVEGSLSAKAGRNLMLSAGPGKCTVPADTLSNAWMPKPVSTIKPWKLALQAFRPSGFTNTEEENAKKNNGPDIAKVMDAYCKLIDEEFKEVKELVPAVNKPYIAILDLIDFHFKNVLKENITETIKKDLIDGKFRFENYLKDKVKFTALQLFNTDLLLDAVSLLNEKLEKLDKHLKGEILSEKLNTFKVHHNLESTGDFKGFEESPITIELCSELYGDRYDTTKKTSIVNNGIEDALLTKTQTSLKRFISASIMIRSGLFEIKKDEKWEILEFIPNLDNMDDNAWKDFCTKQIRFKQFDKLSETQKTVSSVAGSFLSGVGLNDIVSYNDAKGEWSWMGGLKKTFNINGQAGPRAIWDSSSGKGTILISNNDKNSYLLDSSVKENASWIKADKKKEPLDALIAGITNF